MQQELLPGILHLQPDYSGVYTDYLADLDVESKGLLAKEGVATPKCWLLRRHIDTAKAAVGWRMLLH